MVAGPQSAAAQTAPDKPPSIGASSPTGAAPEFDAVSVKLISPDEGAGHSHENSDPKRLTMTCSLHRFLIRAFGITDAQLGGEPDWFRTRLYSLEAVTSVPTSSDQKMLMLRRVLADRFQLKLREEDRDLPVYLLELAAGGPKFKELKPGEVPNDTQDVPGTFARSFTAVADMLNTLNNAYGGRLSVDRPVVDRTHLTGKYNIQLRTEIETQTDDSGRRTTQFPNLFHDLQSELGLKLVPGRVKMPYFVIESASAPTAN
jgi:uncharacterized protein (TIGR03435 family)